MTQSLDEFWNTAPAGQEFFDPTRIGSLPEPAQRYLNHAIAAGTPLARAVRLRMHGDIRLKNWAPFTAEQVIRWDRGMIWQASVRLYGLRITGFDRLVDAHGEMRWKLFGVIPIMSASDADITRSAAGRLAAETIWLPSILALSDVSWSGIDATSACARLTASREAVEMKLQTDETGRLLSSSMKRWGNPGGTNFQYHQFGVIVGSEQLFSGYTIPTELRVGWFFGTNRFTSEGEFFRCTIDQATFR